MFNQICLNLIIFINYLLNITKKSIIYISNVKNEGPFKPLKIYFLAYIEITKQLNDTDTLKLPSSFMTQIH